MLQWLMWLLFRQTIMNGLNRTMRMNTEYGLGQSLMMNTDSPRFAVTPGEWYANETIRMIRTDLHQADEFAKIMSAMCDYKTAEVFPQLDAATAELDDLIVHRTSFPPDKFSAERDSMCMIDCNTEWGFPVSILPRLIVARLDCLI